jgi:hypothetical protein
MHRVGWSMADHVVVRGEKLKPGGFNSNREVSDPLDIGTDLGLGKYETNLHDESRAWLPADSA